MGGQRHLSRFDPIQGESQLTFLHLGDFGIRPDKAGAGIVDAVMPIYLMHGHLHRAYQRTCDFGYGPVRVTGLDADNRLRNFAALDVTTMHWDVRPSWFSRFRRGPVVG